MFVLEKRVVAYGRHTTITVITRKVVIVCIRLFQHSAVTPATLFTLCRLVKYVFTLEKINCRLRCSHKVCQSVAVIG